MHETVYSLIGSYGYLIVFLLVGIESFGIPLPGETALITASAFAAMGRLEIVGVIGAAAAGAILGDNAGYWVGKKGGLALIHKYGAYVRLDEAKIERMHAFFTRHGSKTVFLGRFISLLRSWAAALAGVAQMPYGTFMLWNALGGVAWASIFGTLGFVFVKNLPLLERYLGQATTAMALLAALIVVLVLVGRWFLANRATVSARMSARMTSAVENPRFADFSSHHRRLWRLITTRFARGEYLAIHLLAGFVVSSAALWLFAEVTEDALHHDPLTRFDLALAIWMREHDVPIADGVFHYFSLAGSPLAMGILALAGAALLLFRRQWLFASGWLAAFVGGGLLDRVLKVLIQRPVPRGAGSLGGETFNFATGHALGSIIGYGMLAYLVIVFVARNRDTAIAVVIAATTAVVLIGIAQLYLGILYFSYLIGGYAAGAVWLSACVTGIEIARRQRGGEMAG